MKNDYLSKLKLLLDQYQMDDTEKNDIIGDYSEMYDNWIEYGMSEDEVESKLGEPRSIISELVEGYRRVGASAKDSENPNSKIIALTPFIALIIFFVGGFGYDAWAYAWTAFLIIPITAIILEMGRAKDKHIITALSPFIALIAYGIIGFVYGYWHPGWLVFLIIPVIAIITEAKEIGFLNTLVSLSPFAAIVAFIFFGLDDQWETGWLVFLAIPALGVLNEKSKFKVFIWEVLIIGGALGYLYIASINGDYRFAWLAFIPLIAYATFHDGNEIKEMPKDYRILVVAIILVYVVLGFWANAWGIAWLLFLLIPVYAIVKEVDGNAKLISLMPFISLTIFFSLGWFFELWAYSWLAFLLIPIVAIIKEA